MKAAMMNAAAAATLNQVVSQNASIKKMPGVWLNKK
jgi:hypothetical protein